MKLIEQIRAHFLQARHNGALLTFYTWGLFFIYLWPQALRRTGEGIFAGLTSGIGYDLQIHMPLATIFAYRPMGEWFTHHPLLFSHKNNYPFFADLISGLFIRVGFSPATAFVVPSIVASLALLISLYFFIQFMMGRDARNPLWLCPFITSLFFLAGGLGFVSYFINGPAESYTLMPNWGIYWLNILHSEIFPQRSFLLGLPIALGLFTLFLKWVDRNFVGVSMLHVLALGFGIGLLLFIHPHSFMALAMSIPVFWLFFLRASRQWMMLSLALILSGCLFWISRLGSDQSVNHFIQWNPGWIYPSKGPRFLLSVFLNFGLLVPMAALYLFDSDLRKNKFVMASGFSGIFIFVLCHLFQFSPVHWDNTKLFTWAQLFLCLPIGIVVARLWMRFDRRLSRLGLALSVLVLTGSGLLDTFQLGRQKYSGDPLWSNGDLELESGLRKISSPMDIVLFNPNRFNPWPALSGRPIFLGHLGILHSYGMSTDREEEVVQAIYRGGPEAEELLKEHRIRYVVIGENERKAFRINEAFFQKQYERVLTDGRETVYRINNDG